MLHHFGGYSKSDRGEDWDEIIKILEACDTKTISFRSQLEIAIILWLS